MPDVDVLDTTLRDGSYAINYSFTPALTRTLVRALEACGVRYIEVGHGVGLNAGNEGYGEAKASDEAYMEAARDAVEDAEYGMFCIPGIARLEDVDLAGRHDMGFIRIGTNVTEVETSEPFIERATDHGMFVTANFMKSYVVDPERFAEVVLRSERYGADMVYIVDSAGGMFPETVAEYYDAVREVTDIPLGFHGHDNLGLAVANSLQMADRGVEIIDGSLQGLGRSAGNAPTELLVGALEKKGYDTGIDLLELLKVGHKYIHALVGDGGRIPLDTVAGYAEFHSSFMPKILEGAAREQVDPAELIMEVCEIDKVHVSQDLVDKVARELERIDRPFLEDYGFDLYVGGEEDDDR